MVPMGVDPHGNRTGVSTGPRRCHVTCHCGADARDVTLLCDPAQFGWGACVPVTSVARTNPRYIEATGGYDGRAWYGDVWTMRNLPIISGLEDSGRHDLAGELTWRTFKAFNRR